MKCHHFLISILISMIATSAQAGAENVNWPGDYKSKFSHYFSGDRTANNKQIIRLYANEAAIAGARSNGKLPYGSVVVGELHAARMDGDQPVLSSLGRRIAEKLAAIVVMQRGEGFDDGYAASTLV